MIYDLEFIKCIDNQRVNVKPMSHPLCLDVIHKLAPGTHVAVLQCLTHNQIVLLNLLHLYIVRNNKIKKLLLS